MTKVLMDGENRKSGMPWKIMAALVFKKLIPIKGEDQNGTIDS